MDLNPLSGDTKRFGDVMATSYADNSGVKINDYYEDDETYLIIGIQEWDEMVKWMANIRGLEVIYKVKNQTSGADVENNPIPTEDDIIRNMDQGEQQK